MIGQFFLPWAASDQAVRPQLTVNYAGRVLPFDEGAAIRAARFAGGARPSVDLMTAVITMVFGDAVATRHVAHFDFAGLAIVDPWA